jgi:hypothetical protein
MLGLEHPLTLATLNNLSNLFFKKGKMDEAKTICQQALVEMKKALELEYL